MNLSERFSSLVDAKLRFELTQKDGLVWNTRYEGNAKAGAVKVSVRSLEAEAREYDKAKGLKGQSVTDNFLTIKIDKDYAINEIIDGYEAAAVPDNLIADRLDSAGYSLALQMNLDATRELTTNGTEFADVALTSKTVYAKIVDARTQLSKNKVPTLGRFLIVTPTVAGLLLQADEFINASALNDEVKQSGAIGRVAGFTVFEDAMLEEATFGPDPNGKPVEFVAGHPAWCARVREWAVEPTVKDLSGSGVYIGASSVQGRLVYAHKITNKAAVFVKTKTA